jgi:GNAT superfamily N-acetyltransferase
MIRSAGPDEREALIELKRRASFVWEEDRPHLEAHPEAIDLPEDQIAEGYVSVFEEDGRLLGFATVLPRGDGFAQLDALYVEPDAQGRGIGRRLTEHAVEAARGHGAIGLNLIANANALGFYEKCGFQILAEVQTPWGRGVRMALPLSPR